MKVLYYVLAASYIAFTFSLFPIIKNHVGIPGIALVGLGGWLFGTCKANTITLVILINQFILCDVAYPQFNVYYEDKAMGAILMILIAWLSGTSRKDQDSLKQTTATLEHSINNRSRELNSLADNLIDRIERTRIDFGEQLHDGIGQELTGIQLYSWALAEELERDQNPDATLGYLLRQRAAGAHQMIRQTSRTLFPIRLAETGLAPALDELAACFAETRHIKMGVSGHTIFKDTDETFALQLYRICQECSLSILNNSDADHIFINFRSGNPIHLEITHNGNGYTFNSPQDLDAGIIKYRLQRIGSTDGIIASPDNLQTIRFLIPNPARPS